MKYPGDKSVPYTIQSRELYKRYEYKQLISLVELIWLAYA